MNKRNVRVRPASAADVEAIAPLFDEYRVFYGQPSDHAAARSFLSARIANDESIILVALDGEAAVGFAQLYPSFSSVRAAKSFILNDLFVQPASRRQRAATTLLAAVRDHAAKAGAGLMTLATGVGNRGAQALYEAEGWERDDGFVTYELNLRPRERHADDGES